MVEGLASIASGQPNALHEKLYQTWAEAGFGMLISGDGVPLDSSYCTDASDLQATLSSILNIQGRLETSACLDTWMTRRLSPGSVLHIQ